MTNFNLTWVIQVEDWKTYNILRRAAIQMVKETYPNLTDEQVSKVVDRLFKICRYRDVTKLTACIQNNLARMVAELSRGGR